MVASAPGHFRQLGSTTGFDFSARGLAWRRRVQNFRAGDVANGKIIKFLGPEKSISKKDFQVKNFNFSPPAPTCTFDGSGSRRVRDFCRSPLSCDAVFDFLSSERAKGSKFRAGAPKGSKFRAGAVTNRKIIKNSGPRKIDFQERLSSQKFQFFAAGAQLHF